ncbi:Biofilm PGA synthesis N-glycosyltransferase pgaC [Yersinia kristensenii ATCC 33638]|nr:Biofilm PGA synthesis N-glycosyltransferase pgaC [Yersinia kristensenii ATCC 33638]
MSFSTKPEIDPARYPDTGHKERIEEDKIQQHVAGKEQDHARRDTQHQA